MITLTIDIERNLKRREQWQKRKQSLCLVLQDHKEAG